MCTVTFIPAKDRIYLTSNRDEKHWRTAALPPAAYEFDSGKMLFPKDGDAGGTWVAAHENGNAIVFLNGGLVAHVPNPPYRKSRGLILLDLLNRFLFEPVGHWLRETGFPGWQRTYVSTLTFALNHRVMVFAGSEVETATTSMTLPVGTGGLPSHRRYSGGSDVNAACGQLRLKQETEEGIIEAPAKMR